MSTKEDYYNWKLATFGRDFDIWHDGLSTSAIESLTGEEREKTLRMLRIGVELKDSYAAEALAAMKEVTVIPELHAQLAKMKGEDKVRVALAINTISADVSLSKDLIDVLESDLYWGARMHAAIGLRNFQDNTSERALYQAVEHESKYLIRYHASESLLRRWQIFPSNIIAHREIFELICKPNDGSISADEQANLSEAVVRLEKLHKQD